MNLQYHFEVSDKQVSKERERYKQDFADKFDLLVTGLKEEGVEFDYSLDYNEGIFKFHNVDNFMLQVLLGDGYDVFTYVNYNSIPKDHVVVKFSRYTTYRSITRLYFGISRCYEALVTDKQGKYLNKCPKK